ncbi:MAG: DNA-directed RNA polymerase subunit beta' [Bacteroidota bacterium]
MFRPKRTGIRSDFSEIIISLASPQTILNQSHGKVVESDTRNHRTYKPEKDGLFCECIFGPEEDWKCACGKYKGIKYKGNVCDRCGVEINEKRVRRERMGHIELVAPIVHTWYFRYLPNKIATLLGIPSKKLENLVYYGNYIVIQAGIKSQDSLEPMTFMTRREYYDILRTIPNENKVLSDNNPDKVIVKTGGEAIEMLLKRLDLDPLARDLREQIATESSQQRRADAIKRLELVEAFRSADRKGIVNKPEWMTMRYIPVIPPQMRPSVRLPNGRIATSDITERYRRVIIRNNRLQRLIEIKAPDIILLNEKRMLQESVDALFDDVNKVVGDRTPNSLSTSLKGKSGVFRKHLLGKRVDFSGRSVIVVGPELSLHECGLPKDMAVELFTPFIIAGLIDHGIASTPKEAKKIIEKKEPIVFEILQNKMKNHPVLLNRAPTLHRLSIQAFLPRLVEGKAIQLHPLVCTAFNADFDGDQMGVYLPLSQEAIVEAYILMLSSNNILNPSNGQPITVPSKDIVLGLYYLTKEKEEPPKKPKLDNKPLFSSIDEVVTAYNNDCLTRHTAIKLHVKVVNKDSREKNQVIDTTVGRALFNQYVPKEIGYINELLDSKKVRSITARIYQKLGAVGTAAFLDQIKTLGFQVAYESGLTFSIADIKIPKVKKELIKQAEDDVKSVWDNYYMGLITNTERYNQVIDIWTRANTTLTNLLVEELSKDKLGFNPIYMMYASGARGSRDQLGQLGAMKGLLASSSQGIIEYPILNSFVEGINVGDYFRSGSASRKGLADTATKTADAGHLTRRLASVAQGVIVREEDCQTLLYKKITPHYNSSGDVKLSISEQAFGRILAQDVYMPGTQELILPRGEEVTEAVGNRIDQANIGFIKIRSVLHCETEDGVCIKCYGKDLGRGKLVQIGEPIGIIAAQSIAEPGTQLTLRTFHSGGVALSDIDEGVVKSNLEGVVKLQNAEIVDRVDKIGEIERIVLSRGSELQIIDPDTGKELNSHVLHYGATLFVKDGQKVDKGEALFEWDRYNVVILADITGKVHFKEMEKGVTYKEEKDEQTGLKQKVIIDSRNKSKLPNLTIEGKNNVKVAYTVPVNSYLSVEDGEKVKAGDVLVKIPRSKGELRDITGGLPLVNRLFEARQPFNPVTVSAIDGIVVYGEKKRGNQQIIVRGKDGSEYTHTVSLSDVITAHEGDYVKACYPLADGIISLNSILEVKGRDALFNHMIQEIQNIYRGQGVRIDDKHVEVILKQMTQKVKVIQTGDTWLLPDGLIHKSEFNHANEAVKHKKIITNPGESTFKEHQVVSNTALDAENKQLKMKGMQLAEARSAKTATASFILQGITRAAIQSKSFIAAASFQETVKVLSKAVIHSALDTMHGLHENVIVGRTIPAGTGQKRYANLRVFSEDTYKTLMGEENKTI